MEQQPPSEADNDLVSDDYEVSALSERKKAALRFTDAFLAASPLPEAELERLRDEFGDDALAEMGVGLVLFHGFSKFLIVTGCEPEDMATTVLPAPAQPPVAGA